MLQVENSVNFFSKLLRDQREFHSTRSGISQSLTEHNFVEFIAFVKNEF